MSCMSMMLMLDILFRIYFIPFVSLVASTLPHYLIVVYVAVMLNAINNTFKNFLYMVVEYNSLPRKVGINELNSIPL